MDQETYVRREIVSDLEIRSAGFLKPSQEDYTKTIPKEAADLFSQLDGVEAFARIYCHILPDDEQVTSYEDTGSVTRINGKETPDNIIE